jgi:PleD family two-component response regulator
LRVTASIGLAFAPAGRPRSVSALIATADKGLYQAKNAGRDRTVFSHDIVSRPFETATTIDGE